MKSHLRLRDIAGSIMVTAGFGAVLGPVFCHGAAPSQEFDRYKKIWLGTAIYASDFDGYLPLAFPYRAGSWRWNSTTAVPAGWTARNGHTTPEFVTAERSVVYNSILPYTLTAAFYREPNFSDTWLPGYDQAPSLMPPARVNVQFNGLLHQYSESAIDNPARLPLYWQGYQENIVGFGVSNPVLSCPNVKLQCKFDPNNMPDGGAGSVGSSWFGARDSTKMTVWHYGHSMVFLGVDGSVELRQQEAPVWPNTQTNWSQSAWAAFADNGIGGSPYVMSTCASAGSSVSYAAYFRPDHTFSGPDNCQ